MGFAKEEKMHGVPDSRGILGSLKINDMCTAYCACHFYFPQLLSHTLRENLVSFSLVVQNSHLWTTVEHHHCEADTA